MGTSPKHSKYSTREANYWKSRRTKALKGISREKINSNLSQSGLQKPSTSQVFGVKLKIIKTQLLIYISVDNFFRHLLF